MNAIKKHVMNVSRTRKLEQFYTLCKGGRVLDVGVSAESRVTGENMFLETFRFPDDCYTGLGVMDLTNLQLSHPKKRMVTYPGGRFPFEDKSFDWVFSNAVVEHVGDDAAQLLFINEMLRVAKHVYFTTPNKYFPVESHTNAILLHWLPGDVFYAWCARRRDTRYWDRKNLYLFDFRRLERTIKASNARTYKIIKNRLFGWPMTFSVVCTS